MKPDRLLKLPDASERRLVLLRAGDAPVPPMPPGLAAEMLNAVVRRLRTNFSLTRGGRESF